VAAVHVLKGDIYEAMDVREIAAECYKVRIHIFQCCDVNGTELF